jgi:hypothetical protein
VTSNDAIVELLRRHVLQDGEQIMQVSEQADGLALATDRRHFVVGAQTADWTVGSETWVDDVVIATLDDPAADGEPERFGFLLLGDGGEVYLNDKAAVGNLGRRLADGMDPTGYAEILVAFHSSGSAVRAVLDEPDALRRAAGQSELPDVEPMRLRRSMVGLLVTFSSFARYPSPEGAPLLDVLEWTVGVPDGEAARWASRVVGTGLRVEPSASV